ncbi:hypothetical protein DSM112329_01382 [Paraconexibacter sp. AEG42_29]|uniref:ABC transporter permease n=1 Tax=Paraconexibacter sp. AEG42_29 TaxID=2997339 RepID=A0AAU7ASF2_9ACTN
MSTTMTKPATTPDAGEYSPRPFARPSVARLTAIELRKASDTRASRWLLGLTAFATAAVGLILLFVGDTADHQLDDFLGLTLVPGLVVLPVVGILLMTGEWSQRTALTTFALVPERSRVTRAKILAALGLALGTLVVAVVLSVLLTAVGDAPDPWGIGAAGLGQATLALLLTVLWGVAFGLALASPAAAIVAYFALPTAFSVLGELVSSLDGAWDWVDPNRALTEVGELRASGSDWTHLAVSCSIWIALPLVVGAARLVRREVK